MNEYISKSSIKNIITSQFGGNSLLGLLLAIDAMPAADVAPVVRCKYCRHFHLNMENDPYCDHRDGLPDPNPDDFCSYGQREENQNV